MKKEQVTKGRKPKTKVWLIGLLGAIFIGMSGACGEDTESEQADRSMSVAENVSKMPEEMQEMESQELVAEILPAIESETKVMKELGSELTDTPKPTNTPAPTAEPDDDRSIVPEGTNYILNTNTKKFHYPTCSSVDRMKEKNKSYYTGTREEVIGMGYEPCGNCKP